MLRFVLPLLLLLGRHVYAATPEMDYAALRSDVVKAYAQQAQEMTESLKVLQELSSESASVLSQLEAACA